MGGWRTHGRARNAPVRRLAAALLLVAALFGAVVPAAADEPATLRVRAWDHGPFGRMVFDLSPGLAAEPVLLDGTLTIRFSRAVAVDVPLVDRRLKNWLGEGSLDAAGQVLTFTLRGPAALKVDHVGRSLVVDLRSAPAVPQAVSPPPPAPPAPAAAVAETPPTPTVTETPPAPAAASDDAPAPVTAVTDADTVGVPGSPAPVTLVVSPTLSGTRLTVTFDRAAAAAVFVRGRALWLVFNRPAFGDLSNAVSGPIERLGMLEPVPVEGAVAWRLAGGAVLPTATLQGTHWQFDFAAQGAAPARPVSGRVQPTPSGAVVMAYGMTGATAPVTLLDPAVGDSIVVVPAAAPGPGVLEPASSPDFDLLASAVGLAVVPKADDVTVASGPEAVTVGADGRTLILSDSAAASRPAGGAGEPLADLDVARWARSTADQAMLRRAAALAPAAARPALRLQLACALVADGLAAEALGEAALAAEQDGTMDDNPVFRQMRGIAAAMMNRAALAAADLAAPALEFSPDAALWRGLALAEQRRPREAAEALAKGEGALRHYPPRQRDRLYAAMVETALATDDIQRATMAATQFSARAATPSGKAQALALAGRLAQRQGDAAGARALLRQALATGDPRARVDAELGLIAVGMADRSMTGAQAIERLDRLRFAWRGDDKELQVLKRLGELQLAQGQWRDGLETLRRALRLFPDSPAAGDLVAAQRAAFQRLFLDGEADHLPPIQAVALYFDYRDLTPLGRDGDEMIRRLADRLTDVDLLDQAKALLQHQVDYRLSGIAQAQVAARLALLHLIDRAPAEALAVLDRTEQPRLPDSLGAQRRLMRAKALSLLGRLDEARALVADDHSPDGLQLAAEIAWNNHDWAGAAASLAALIDGAGPAEPLPAATAALVLRRAAALALAGDQPALAALGGRFGAAMARTTLAEAFAGLTDSRSSSPQQMRNLAQTLANGSGLGSFVDTLETRLRAGPLSAIN